MVSSDTELWAKSIQELLVKLGFYGAVMNDETTFTVDTGFDVGALTCESLAKARKFVEGKGFLAAVIWQRSVIRGVEKFCVADVWQAGAWNRDW